MEPMFAYKISSLSEDTVTYLSTIEVFNRDVNNISLRFFEDFDEKHEEYVITVGMSVVESIERVLDKYMDLIESDGELINSYFSERREERNVAYDDELVNDTNSGDIFNEFVFNYRGKYQYYLADEILNVDPIIVKNTGAYPEAVRWRLMELLYEIRGILIPQGIDPKCFSTDGVTYEIQPYPVEPIFYYTQYNREFVSIEVYNRDVNNIRLWGYEFFTVDMSVIESIERVLDRYMDLIELGHEWDEDDDEEGPPDEVLDDWDEDDEEEGKDRCFGFCYKDKNRYIFVEDLNKYIDKKVLDSEGNPPVIQWRLIELLDEIRAILIPQGIDPKFLSP